MAIMAILVIMEIIAIIVRMEIIAIIVIMELIAIIVIMERRGNPWNQTHDTNKQKRLCKNQETTANTKN